jgi:hypothetical protein
LSYLSLIVFLVSLDLFMFLSSSYYAFLVAVPSFAVFIIQ